MDAIMKLLVMCIACKIGVFTTSTDIIELTESNLQTTIKGAKCMFLYATRDDCEKCKLLYPKFLVTAQTFATEHDIVFGRVSDMKLLRAFEVTAFPGIVYYEYGSAVPKVYLGDITSGALSKVFSDAMKIDFKKVDRQFALQLTTDNFNEIMYIGKQYCLVMLHETDDIDDIDNYDEVAETFQNEENVIVARIDVNLERTLRKEYNAVYYPSFYWYSKETALTKKRYDGDLDVTQMISFINKEGGFFRMKGGRLNPYAGLIKPLDDVVNMHGKDIYEIDNFEQIRLELNREISKLSSDIDYDLAQYYLYIVEEIWEDRTIEALDEMRNRIFRMMEWAGPLAFDQLIRKRNIVQKYIDIIGMHLLQQLSDGDFGSTADIDKTYGFEEHGLEFHEEL